MSRGFHVCRLVDRIECMDATFDVREMADGHSLQVIASLPCSITGEYAPQKGRKWYISPHATDSEVVQTAFLAIKTFLLHELHELFKFDDVAIFSPHLSATALAAFAGDPASHEYRPVPPGAGEPVRSVAAEPPDLGPTS